MTSKKIVINDDGVQLRVNSKIYSKEVVFAVGYVMLDKIYILLDADKSDIVINLYPKKKKADLQKLGLEFYNELLNYAHYFSRIQNNAEAIKMIMQKAMFSAAPSLVQEAEDKEINDLIKELEEEESKENAATAQKRKK